MNEKYLPVGTVVTLKGANKKVMIIGYCPVTSENKFLDYSACTYPEGVISSDKTLAFNHDQIELVNYIGFGSQEQVEFDKNIKKMLKDSNVASKFEHAKTGDIKTS